MAGAIIRIRVDRDHGAEKFVERLLRNIEGSMTMWGMLLADKAQKKAPEKTGTMTRSVTVSPVQSTGNGFLVQVGPGPEAPYAPYTELERYILAKHLGPISISKGATMPWLFPSLHDPDTLHAGIEMVKAAVRAAQSG